MGYLPHHNWSAGFLHHQQYVHFRECIWIVRYLNLLALIQADSTSPIFLTPLRGTIPIHAGQQNLSDRKPPKVGRHRKRCSEKFQIMVGEKKHRPISFIIVGKIRWEKKRCWKVKNADSWNGIWAISFWEAKVPHSLSRLAHHKSTFCSSSSLGLWWLENSIFCFPSQ